jgi:hypothetical protein
VRVPLNASGVWYFNMKEVYTVFEAVAEPDFSSY